MRASPLSVHRVKIRAIDTSPRKHSVLSTQGTTPQRLGGLAISLKRVAGDSILGRPSNGETATSRFTSRSVMRASVQSRLELALAKQDNDLERM